MAAWVERWRGGGEEEDERRRREVESEGREGDGKGDGVTALSVLQHRLDSAKETRRREEEKTKRKE